MININEMKNQTFDSYTVNEWKDAVEASLKNKSFQQLYKKTYEQITLKPLYTKECLDSLQIDEIPGEGLHTRGFQNYTKQWHISQMPRKRDWNEIKLLIKKYIEKGQSTISFQVDELENIEEIDFRCFYNGNHELLPFFFITKKNFQLMINKVIEAPVSSEHKGVIGSDIISRKLDEGNILQLNSQNTRDWLDSVIKADKHTRHLKTILIDTTPYHNGGANIVQELAIALAEAVFYLEMMKEQMWKPDKTVKKMVFHFAIGSNFFMEIAKIRAFRKLWSTVANAYGIESNNQKITISAETSSFTKSALDPYVNLLRSGNEAFSAIIGGVDYLHVSGYNEVGEVFSEFASRIARNTQLILREEVLLDKTVDPAGGSYYIETITNELVNKAWSLFQRIEGNGGILEALQSGWIQTEITDVLEERLNDIATRKKSMIGTNVYANLSEETVLRNHLQVLNNPLAIPAKRASEAFEELRRKTKELEKQEGKLLVGLICLGKLKEHKARADFVTGFLSTGGIHVEWSSECNNLEDVQRFVHQNPFKYYCICGTNEMYDEMVFEISQWFQNQNPLLHLDVAGAFTNEKLEELSLRGIKGTIHMHQNIIKKITSLLKLWEVQPNE